MPRPTPAALAAEIQAYCSAHANADLAAKYARFFKEDCYDAWGLMDAKHEFWNARQADWLERYRPLGLTGFLRLGELLFASGKYEEGAIAIRFVKAFGSDFDSKALPGLARWFASGLRNWAHTDVLCAEILIPALRDGRIGLEELAEWRASPHAYQRRAVPVAALGLFKGQFSTHVMLDLIRPLMTDADRVVHQGTGWYLREFWKKTPHVVEPFLLHYKDSAPRLIFQYATEKMSPEEKARFKASPKRAATAK
jgi:3-methyladenine DNA glycosylase AlkD